MRIYLDLLPEDKKKELKRKKTFRLIIKREVLFAFPLIVFLVILFNIYVVLGIQKENISSSGMHEQTQGQYKELKDYEDKFKQTNDLTIALTRMQKEHIHWSWLINKISEITPAGIFLNGISTKDYQVLLIGKAKSRDDLMAFKDVMEKMGCAEQVTVPLSNLVTKDNVDFQMDFMVKPECLKDKLK